MEVFTEELSLSVNLILVQELKGFGQTERFRLKIGFVVSMMLLVSVRSYLNNPLGAPTNKTDPSEFISKQFNGVENKSAP